MNERTPRTRAAIDMANKAIDILIERGKSYDNNVLEKHASVEIMLILYPDGSPIFHDDMVRYKYIFHIVEIICRYRRNGKEDNLLDLANYAFLLAAFDKEGV
jgi:hypothetical protein